ncbi:hypothetical protein AB0H43_26120 [Hamadaea sp. NPDC050747]
MTMMFKESSVPVAVPSRKAYPPIAAPSGTLSPLVAYPVLIA